jgi:hypothetical protein
MSASCAQTVSASCAQIILKVLKSGFWPFSIDMLNFGRYLVNVYFNGSHIPNSPFKVRVCNPEAIWAEGPGLMDSFVGDQGDFQVFTRDAGHGTLSECYFEFLQQYEFQLNI